MTTPGLRPLSIGEILDAGIKVVVRHWKPLIKCIVGLTAPVWILYVLVIASVDSDLLDADSQFSTSTSSSSNVDVDPTVWVGLGLSGLLALVTFLIAFTACFKIVSDAWLGSTPTVRSALRFGLRRSPMVALLGLISGVVIGIGFVLCLLPGIWLSVLWCIAFPALLFERVGPFKAMGRSGSLIKGRWWASFALVIVGYLLVWIIGSIIQYGLLAIATVVAADNVVVSAIATVVGSTVSSAISYPYLAAVLTILYFDQRVRKEGFDLQLQADGLGGERDPDAPLPAPLIGDDLYTPEQRAAAPYWPPPPGWVPPAAEPKPSEWASSSGWAAPAAQDPPLWGSGEATSGDPLRPADDAPPTYPTRPADDAPPTYPTHSSGDAEPADPLPPREDAPAQDASPGWSRPAPPPPEPKKHDDKPDSGRADWLPPEAPRGPGGL